MLKRVTYELGRALRETGQALDRVGLRAVETPIFKEPCESCLASRLKLAVGARGCY